MKNGVYCQILEKLRKPWKKRHITVIITAGCAFGIRIALCAWCLIAACRVGVSMGCMGSVRKISLTFCMLFLLLLFSCDGNVSGRWTRSGNEGIVEIDDSGSVNSLLVLNTNGYCFNSAAAGLLTAGTDISHMFSGLPDGVSVVVAEDVSKGDTELVVRIEGALGSDSSSGDKHISVSLGKDLFSSLPGGAAAEDVSIGVVLTKEPGCMLRPQVVMSGKNSISFYDLTSEVGVEVTLDLINLKFNSLAQEEFRKGRDLASSDIFPGDFPDWVSIVVREPAENGGDRLGLTISGVPDEARDFSFVLDISSDWMRPSSSNVSEPAESYVFGCCFKNGIIASLEYGIRDSGDKELVIRNTDDDVSGSIAYSLDNLRFNGHAERKLRKGADMKALGACSGLPDWALLTVAKDIRRGDAKLLLRISGTPNTMDDAEYEVVLDRNWFERSSDLVKEITSDFVFRYSIKAVSDDSQQPSDNGGQGSDDGSEGQSEGTGDDDANNGDSAGSDDSGGNGGDETANLPVEATNKGSNSVELIAGKSTIIDTGNARNLYTITIGYPEGEYAGVDKSDWSLKGEGRMRSGGYFSLSGKSVPESDDVRWIDMVGYVGKETGLYWFTDTKNKVKYYISEDAKKGLWGELGDEYWNEMKRNFLNGTLRDDVLGAERSSFELVEYDSDKTEYFYVIVTDFGANSVRYRETAFGKSFSGTSGAYDPTNIRPGSFSNNADVFYINSRYLEGYSEKFGRSRLQAAEAAVGTLVHEYMHFLMDSNVLLKAEAELTDFIDDETGTVYDSEGRTYAPIMYASSLNGSLFWIEGTANYAPYRILGKTDENAVKSWLESMDTWRPEINAYDTGADSGNDYAVYGAGGLFFSYVAAKYGEDVENKFHSWRDSLYELIRIADADYYLLFCNINRMTKSILYKDFKDAYLEYLCQCASDLSASVSLPECASSQYECTNDWGFTKSVVDGVLTEKGFRISNARTGYEHSDLPELSFVINKWDQIPESIRLEGEGVRSFAFWF